LLQLGDTVLRYEGTAEASSEDEAAELLRWPARELLPNFDADGVARWASALLSSHGELGVCRTAASELRRILKTDDCFAFITGTSSVPIPQSLIRAALERAEVCRAGRLICFPMLNGDGTAMGALCAEREGDLTEDELRAGASLGRLAGDALAAARRCTQPKPIVLVGSAAAFRQTVKKAESWSARSSTLLLYGERGSGKGFLAEYLHSRSVGARAGCVTVHCGDESARLEPELLNACQRADGGTLILRNVEWLPKASARWLSHLLKQPSAPGGPSLDVRLLATAGQRLEVLGELFAGASLEVPSLRKRTADIPALFKAFTSAKARALGIEPPRLSPQAQRLFLQYRWPGNVAELRLVAERLTLLYSGLEVGPSKLPTEIIEGAGDQDQRLKQKVVDLERQAIASALLQARGKKIRAAEMLGISRPTLDKKIRELHLVLGRGKKD
jgi:transcriptional regulator of acetoin/glycerol metabolism